MFERWIRVGFVQTNPVFGQVAENNAHIASLVLGAQADLLVLPELANTGYMFENVAELRSLAEPVPNGPTVQVWAEIARKGNVYLVGCLAELDGDAVYDTAVLLGPEGYIGKYRKTHLFNREVGIFTPGDTGFPVFRTPIGTIGLMICFDYMFPEAARTLALKGAQIICCPVNLATPPRIVMNMLSARALENGVFVIGTNRVGEERGHLFKGGSMVIGPRMQVLAGAPDVVECVRIVEVNLGDTLNKQYTPNNHLLGDRRPKLYDVGGRD